MLSLPNELLDNILLRLPMRDLAATVQVNRRLHTVGNHERFVDRYLRVHNLSGAHPNPVACIEEPHSRNRAMGAVRWAQYVGNAPRQHLPLAYVLFSAGGRGCMYPGWPDRGFYCANEFWPDQPQSGSRGDPVHSGEVPASYATRKGSPALHSAARVLLPAEYGYPALTSARFPFPPVAPDAWRELRLYHVPGHHLMAVSEANSTFHVYELPSASQAASASAAMSEGACQCVYPTSDGRAPQPRVPSDVQPILRACGRRTPQKVVAVQWGGRVQLVLDWHQMGLLTLWPPDSSM